MEKVIGRQEEMKLFQEALKSKVPELIGRLWRETHWQNLSGKTDFTKRNRF
jgi:hypothetical protein